MCARDRPVNAAPEPINALAVAKPPVLNAFSVVSFVLGLFGFCGWAIISIVFGVLGLREIKRKGHRGRGFAVSGLILSAA
jgi:hypothetical protein